MLLKEFRIAHSTLIEHYQFMESHLEGIYAAISGKSFLDGIREIEKDSLSGVIREIRDIERQKNIQVFTQEEHKQLRAIVERRNFWCHSCYYEMSFDLQTGGPARVRDVQALVEDTQVAEAWRKKLFARKVELLEKNNVCELAPRGYDRKK